MSFFIHTLPLSAIIVHLSLMLHISSSLDCGYRCPQNKTDINDTLICASNGVVYKSECEMEKDNCGNNVTEADWEKCRGNHPLCPSNCLDIHDPICGDDGRIYPNKCLMHKRNCGKVISEKPQRYCFSRNRQGRKYDACPKDCLELYKPVCGSDGQIYMNECILRQKNCGARVQMVQMNRCVEIPKCPEMCIALYDPVCGSDGSIYLNHCRLLKENCGKNIRKMPLRFCVGDDEDKV